MRKLISVLLSAILALSFGLAIAASNDSPNHEAFRKNAYAQKQGISTEVTPYICFHSWEPWISMDEDEYIDDYVYCYIRHQYKARGCNKCNEVQIKDSKQTKYKHVFNGVACINCGVLLMNLD